VKILIKVKLQDLVNASQTLRNLGDKPLRGKLAYKVGKIIQQVSNELELYDNARRELLEKYCEKNEDGTLNIHEDGNVLILPENISVYNEEIKKMNETEIELNIVLLDLDELENIEMTPKEMMQIDWIIKKEEAE